MQVGVGTVPEISVTRVRSRVGVLPEGGESPSGRERAKFRSVIRDPKRVVVAKGRAVASASGPPVGRGVNDYKRSISTGYMSVTGQFTRVTRRRCVVRSIC